MRIQAFTAMFYAALLLFCGNGCDKASTPSKAASPPPLVTQDTVLRVHWLGKKCLGTNAQTYYFMRLWGLPESKQVQSQTLDKLSLLLANRLRKTTGTNASNSPLHSLLDDVVQEETVFEIREAANHANEAAFAIRLDRNRALVWQSNLQAFAASAIQSKRVGDWTLLDMSAGENRLFDELVERVGNESAPFSTSSNYWLEIDCDPLRLANVLGSRVNQLSNAPKRISISVFGDGGNVITHGRLSLSESLPLQLEPWLISTNLIHGPLASFAAARNLRPLLASMNAWNNLQVGPPPNQAFSWSSANAPLETYLAMPSTDAFEQAHLLIDTLLRRGNPWLATNSIGIFESAPDTNSVKWSGLPLFTPFLHVTNTSSGAFLFAGTTPSTKQTNLPAADIPYELLNRTNLIACQWESTELGIDSGLNLGQVLRLIVRREPLSLETPGAAWLNALIHRVGPCTTIVTAAGTNQIVFERKSTVGFTGPELHLFAEWLRSPALSN